MNIHESFEIAAPLIGGSLIGLAASALLYFNGRIAGISGIIGGALSRPRNDMGWRMSFVGGLLVGGVAMLMVLPGRFDLTMDRSMWAIVAAGLLVGFGTRMGNGCTSGHGVCGLSRLSPRSLIATLSFIGSGVLAVTIINRVFGGAL